MATLLCLVMLFFVIKNPPLLQQNYNQMHVAMAPLKMYNDIQQSLSYKTTCLIRPDFRSTTKLSAPREAIPLVMTLLHCKRGWTFKRGEGDYRMRLHCYIDDKHFHSSVCLQKRVSEPLLLYAKRAIFQPYHGESKLHFNEMMMMSALYQTNMLTVFVFLNSAGSTSPWVDMLLHSDTSRFRANHSLLLLLKAGGAQRRSNKSVLQSMCLT